MLLLFHRRASDKDHHVRLIILVWGRWGMQTSRIPFNQMLCKRPADCISRSKQTWCSINVWTTCTHLRRCSTERERDGARVNGHEWREKGGRHNIYLVSLTGKPRTFTKGEQGNVLSGSDTIRGLHLRLNRSHRRVQVTISAESITHRDNLRVHFVSQRSIP